MRRSTTTSVAMLGLLVGCTVVPPPESDWRDQLDHDVWAHADPSLFDALDKDAVWSPGDEVHYAIESQANGQRRRWVLEFRLPAVKDVEERYRPVFADPHSGIRRVNLLTGSLSHSSTKGTLLRYSTRGDLAVRLRHLDEDAEFATTVKTQLHGHVWQEHVLADPDFGIGFMFRVLIKVERLFEELISVVRPPSLASVFTRGMKIYVDLKPVLDEVPEVTQVDTPFGRVPAFWMKLRLMANDQLAMNCRFLITWRRSPMNLCVGVLRIEGRHPDDPTRRLSARVIRATRGALRGRTDVLGPHGLRVGMTEAEMLQALDAKPTRRHRLRFGGTEYELLTVTSPKTRVGRRIGVFVGGRLRYINSGGAVSRYLHTRGGPSGPFKKTNLVWEAAK